MVKDFLKFLTFACILVCGVFLLTDAIRTSAHDSTNQMHTAQANYRAKQAELCMSVPVGQRLACYKPAKTVTKTVTKTVPITVDVTTPESAALAQCKNYADNEENGNENSLAFDYGTCILDVRKAYATK